MEARTKLSQASNFGGIAFPLTNVHAGHAATDTLSASYHSPHGLNCAWVTPAILELCAESVSDKVKMIGEAMGLTFSGNESNEEIGRLAGDKNRELMRACGIPSMEAYGLDREVVLSGADYVVNSGISPNCPTEMTKETAERLFAIAYDAYR